METGLSKNKVIAELTRSPHGDLAQYIPVATTAAKDEAEFFAHLVSWNNQKGQIRDAKVALPVIAHAHTANAELRENAVAHIALLDPRNLVRAVRFRKSIGGGSADIKRVATMYLRAREQKPGWFNRTALQHRGSLKELYALLHIKPGPHAQKILFSGEKTGVFGVVARLQMMPAKEAAGAIMEFRIPFLTAMGALGARAKEPDVVLALIERMSPTELVTNAKSLLKLIGTNAALKAAYDAGLTRASESKASVFKTTKAAEAVGGKAGEALRGVQEKQLDKLSVKGNWLVIADKSGSMTAAIEAAKHIAATLARVADGQVWLVFVDTTPRGMEVTGKTLDWIQQETRFITAGGGTSLGCGVKLAVQAKWPIDGIAVVSDGGENNLPYFSTEYRQLCDMVGKDVPVYLYDLPGDSDSLTRNMNAAGFEVQKFDLRHGKLDYYALPNLINTMRVSTYSLVDEIMSTPLLTLKEVFAGEEA